MGSRSKDTTVILLDVSTAMHPHLPETIRSLQGYLQQKFLSASGQKDEVGLVLFGCDCTDNDLNEQMGGYEGVIVANPIQPVNLNFVKHLDTLPRGDAPADFLDAVVVGLGLLIERAGDKKLPGKKRLWLLTNLESPVKEPCEGTIEDQAATIAGRMLEMEVRLEVTRIHFKQEVQTSTSIENEILLRKFVTETHGQIQTVSSALALSGTLAAVTPSKAPTTTYRGPLEVTPSLKVNIWCYKKTVEAKLPSLKGYSDRAPASDPTAQHEMERITAYKSTADPDREVPPAEHTKAYRYGPQFIPVDQHVEEGLKFRADKGVKVIGFTHSKHVPRHLFMHDSNVFIAEPGNETAAVSFSALVRAMHQTNRVAILRCVYRANQSSVALSVGTPCPAEEDHLPDSLIVNQLPFAEDVREYPFLALADQPESKQPSLEQMDLAERLVQTLDLAPAGGEELLAPEATPNPTLERFYTFLHKRAAEPNAALPPINPTARAVIEPPPRLLEAATPLIEDFQSKFSLAVAAIEDKPSKRFWRDRHVAGEDEAPAQLENGASASASGTAGAPISLDDLAARKVDEVGTVNPVQDFDAMIARTDDPNLVPKAIKGMKDVIDNLVTQAYQGNTYDQALECLRALRRGCILQSVSRLRDFPLSALPSRSRLLQERFLNKRASVECVTETVPRCADAVLYHAFKKICVDDIPDARFYTKQEPLEFNSYLREIAARSKGKRQHDFWERLVKCQLTLINRDEEPDSDVSLEEAQKFLTEAEAKPSTSAVEEPEKDEEVDEMAELLDMAE